MNFETANPQGGVESTPMSEAEHLFEPQSSLAVDAGEAEFEEDGERIDDGEDMPPEDEDAEDFEEEDSEEEETANHSGFKFDPDQLFSASDALANVYQQMMRRRQG